MKYCILSFLLLINCGAHAQQKSYNNRILVVGGGGMRGAWGGGYAEYLSDSLGPYRIVYGTSTGSLLAPLIVLDSFERLKNVYTHVTQKSIFNYNPFNKRTGQLNFFKVALRIMLLKSTFGETKNLRRLMDNFFDSSDYNKIIDPKNKLRYTVATENMRTGIVEYKCSDSFKDDATMKNWMWASANEPLFMSYYFDGKSPFDRKPIFTNYEKYYSKTPNYADGGVMANIPLLEAVDYALANKINYIDVIINKPVNPVDTSFDKKGLLKGLQRLIELWETQIRNDNVIVGQFEAISNDAQNTHEKQMGLRAMRNEEKLTITLHYYPSYMYFDSNAIYQKELLFNKGRMDGLWTIGQKHIEDPYPATGEINGHVIIIPLKDSSLHSLIKLYRKNKGKK